MKKIISLLCALALIGSAVLTPMPANAECTTVREVEAFGDEYYSEWPDREAKSTKVTEDGLVFEVYDKYAYLVDCEYKDITEVTIPDKINDVDVVGIDGSPFGFCRKLESITLPDTLKYFLWMNLTAPTTKAGSNENPVPTIKEVKVSETNPYYTVADGILFSKDMKTVVGCPPAVKYNISKLPEETETIGLFAFAGNSDIEEAVIPDTVKKIMLNAFRACPKLKSVTLPKSITEVQSDTFSFCTSLTDVKFNGKITAIGPTAFAFCDSLKKFDIPDTVTYIGWKAFEESACIEDVDGLYYVDNWCVGGNVNKLSEISLREGTVGIAEMSLIMANRSVLFEIPESLKYIGRLCYQTSRGELTTIRFRGNSLNEDTFAGVKKLKDIYIYNNDCDIFDSEKTIPAKWKHVTDNTDYDQLIKDEEEKAKQSGNGSGNSTSSSKQKSISVKIIDLDAEEETTSEFPDSTPYISGPVITDDENTIKLYIGPDEEPEVTEGDTVIHGYKGSTAEAYAEKYNRKFEVIGSVYYDASTKHEEFTDEDYDYMTDGKYAWLNNCNNKDIKEAVIPEKANDMCVVGTTGEKIFKGCTKLEKLTLNSHISPADLPYIGTEDSPLTAYDISPDNEAPYTVIDGVVYSYAKKFIVQVPNGLEGEFVIPENVENIASEAFSNCSRITSVVMGDNIKRINPSAFEGCTSLKDIKLPEGLEYIGLNAFPENTYTAEKDGVHYVGNWAVTCDKTNDTDIEITDGTVGLANMLFYMDSIGTLTIPASVKYYPEEQQNIKASALKIYSDAITDEKTNSFYTIIKAKDYFFYNKECEIPDSFLYKRTDEEGLTIYGFADSTAETFAKDKGIKFELIDSEIDDAVCSVKLEKARIQKITESEENLEIQVKGFEKPFIVAKDSKVAEGLAEHPVNVGDTVSGIFNLSDDNLITGIDVNTDSFGGDANCDDEVSMADAVLIMQALANPDKYAENGTDEHHLTASGRVNADIEGGEDGMTNRDALAIQKRLLNIK